MTKQYTSKDFSHVPAELSVEIPEHLIHCDVLASTSEEEQRFSNERHHLVKVVDLPSRFISMTLGGLEPGQSTRLHRHNYETIIYVLDGCGESKIGERTVAWKAGDAFYVPVWTWHQHTNRSNNSIKYIACENAPMLQNMGLALRQER